MKIGDHNVDVLTRSLKDEAERLRFNAKRLEDLAKAVKNDIKDGSVTCHSFEFVAQEAIDIITHRSNVHPQTIARTCASLAADAAVEWVEAERVRELDAAFAAES